MSETTLVACNLFFGGTHVAFEALSGHTFKRTINLFRETIKVRVFELAGFVVKPIDYEIMWVLQRVLSTSYLN